MLAGIRDILIISTPSDLPNFEQLLGDVQPIWHPPSYKVQFLATEPAPGLPDWEEFIAGDACAMILGGYHLLWRGMPRFSARRQRPPGPRFSAIMGGP